LKSVLVLPCLLQTPTLKFALHTYYPPHITILPRQIMTPSFLVTGATGRQGGSVTRELLSKGASVHALVRNPESAAASAIQRLGAKIFKGDFLDITTIEKAAVGVTGIFLNPMMQLEPPDTQLQQAQNVIIAAERSPTVKAIVVSTVIAANRHDEWLEKDPNYLLASFYGPKDAVEKAN
jgi:uncharacterized protein YbjT (DUF2867 family)